MKRFIAILLCAVLALSIVSCNSDNEEHQHEFGVWTQSSPTSMYRTCIVCGHVETSVLEGADTPTADSDHSYTNFASFVADCNIDGNKLTYNGQHNKITVSLAGGNTTDSCAGKKVIIPSRVTDIQFIGLASGSPFSDFTLEFEDRVNDINLTFNDVRIEAHSTIITSNSRSINFNIKMLGKTCSFINLGKGSKGADGYDGITNDDQGVYGKAGGAGSHTFVINGKVTIDSQATLLEIQGADGGDGGKGGHITTSSAPSGGDGGAGGNAILGEENATVNVAFGCTANIQGGAGGTGGAGGSSDIGYWGSNRTGATGKTGANGVAGCDIIQN